MIQERKKVDGMMKDWKVTYFFCFARAAAAAVDSTLTWAEMIETQAPGTKRLSFFIQWVVG
ncbi:MAG: hypothetical protein ACREH8_12860 [Opitutaceae bacterium]